MTDAVLDAGPLIHLSEIDALDVLSDLQVLRISNTVWDEVAAHQPQALKYRKLSFQRANVSTPSTDLQTLAVAFALDRGEIDSLCLMEKYPTAMFLTDDAAARLVAEQRGYRAHGTIGLLIRSVRRGERKADEILTLLRTLPQRSTLFIRPDLLKNIIGEVENEWKTE